MPRTASGEIGSIIAQFGQKTLGRRIFPFILISELIQKNKFDNYTTVGRENPIMKDCYTYLVMILNLLKKVSWTIVRLIIEKHDEK